MHILTVYVRISYISLTLNKEILFSECNDNAWGENCTKTCDCVNSIECNHVTGCVCEDGWNGTYCEYDIDECEGDPNICNDSLLECLNFDGDYMCICKQGFVKSDNGSCFGKFYLFKSMFKYEI